MEIDRIKFNQAIEQLEAIELPDQEEDYFQRCQIHNAIKLLQEAEVK